MGATTASPEVDTMSTPAWILPPPSLLLPKPPSPWASWPLISKLSDLLNSGKAILNGNSSVVPSTISSLETLDSDLFWVESVNEGDNLGLSNITLGWAMVSTLVIHLLPLKVWDNPFIIKTK